MTNETILIVDDEKNILDLYDQELQEEGYSTFLAQNGKECLEIIKNEAFTVDEFNALVDLLKKNDGIVYTEKKAEFCIEKAKEALSVFEPSKTKDSLLDIANYTLSRRT